MAGMVYLYYRAGMDSVGVASELGIKPQHVRQTIWRLHRTADLIAGVRESFLRRRNAQHGSWPAPRSSGWRKKTAPRELWSVLNLRGSARPKREERRIVWAAECVRRAAEREAMSITRDAEKFRREAERLQRASVRALRVPKASRERNCTCGNPLPRRATKYCVACKPKTHHRFQDRTCACGNPLPPWVRTCADCKKERGAAFAFRRSALSAPVAITFQGLACSVGGRFRIVPTKSAELKRVRRRMRNFAAIARARPCDRPRRKSRSQRLSPLPLRLC